MPNLRLRLALPIILAALGASVPAAADPDYDSCVDAATSNADYAACGAAMLERREAEVAKQWQAVLADADVETRESLEAEQRAWLAYKDASCRWWTTGAFGREGQTIHFFTCRELVLEQRINYLKSIGE